MNSRNSQFINPYAEATKVAMMVESLENYSIANDRAATLSSANPETSFANPASGKSASPVNTFTNDALFWEKIFANPDKYYGEKINLIRFTVSSWVPRVPGLYWAPQSKITRVFSEGSIERVGKDYVHYNPVTKSALVLGGIGTLAFAPDSEGYRIISLSSEQNASMGIPAIIPNHLYQKYSLEEGPEITLKNGIWQSMKKEWEQRFPFTARIPRAYLIIDDNTTLEIVEKVKETVIQPFSIMEYEDGDAFFYDYVFCTVTAYKSDSYIQKAADFFEAYKNNKSRHGRYLIAADPNGRIFDAEFSSPEELLRYDDSGKTNLSLIQTRIKNTYYNGQLLDDIIKTLSSLYQDETSIRRIGKFSGISPASIKTAAPAQMINQLVEQCIARDTLETLIEKAALENPGILANNLA